MNGHLILAFFSLGGAALAAWLFVRFPSAGPRRLSSIIASVVAVWAGMMVGGWVFDVVTRIDTYGVAIGLMAVVLPLLTLTFWVTACVLRTLAATPGLRG